MSTNVLQIDSSVFTDAGVSHQLTQKFLAELKAQSGDIAVTHRDLGLEPIPHLDADTIGEMGEGKAKLANELLTELQEADILVLGVPMYNFGVPSVLKAWFDHIAQAGKSFQYTANGPEGLITGKKVFVLATRGGVHRDTPVDTQTGFLKNVLGFLGMTDVTIIYAEGLNMSGDSRAEAIAKAELEIQSQVQSIAQRASVL
ncbi:FMN-dependent NADH-azoreductase [Teredinibacter haidensis]|uniref:FMN-dependent NADH-azoreductase n=1 Tax=Teredinibacter haidensis TaxID=2731755 RepID=UPI000948CEEC|nr:FMN-dependent NADH-azoreductase [Teredinibacter haidensis]